ncbi:MAG: NADP-dependent oxidoreductase, partial [Pseudomonadota bacterium]|nr:NADP-dependent oxidoreductase [Pseudomonadota bacterium]
MSEFRKWTLAKHPVGVPERDCFALEPCAQGDIQDGEVLIKVDYFSLDPGMRGRLSGDSYAAGLKIGDTIESAGIGTILEAKSDKFAPGDVVSGALGWCEATVHRDRGLKKIEPSLLSEHVSATAFIGVLGVPGLTAWFGLNNLGGPSEGETLLISSAAGPVGATCGQLGKHLGLKVVGIAGGPEKCAYLRSLGFDDAIDYKAGIPLDTAIAAACADGVNIFFDNVGAETLDAALVNMAAGGRIVVS